MAETDPYCFFTIREGTERVFYVKNGHDCMTVVSVSAGRENKVFLIGMESNARAIKNAVHSQHIWNYE